MTLLGSIEPTDTPAEGTLSLWLRPLRGSAAGRRFSSRRWVHSPTWSDSGRAVAHVANEPPTAFIVHVDIASGEETVLGVPGAVNCLPRFDGDDRTLLFCSGASARGPFRVYRQTVGDADPVALTPAGADCLLPVTSNPDGRVLCARVEADHLNWVESGLGGLTDLIPQCGLAERPTLLQTWAGIAAPLSPDHQSVLFFDTDEQRIRVWHVAEGHVRGHWAGSIAACWLDDDVLAVVAEDRLLIVNTKGWILTTLSGSSWIPLRYVPTTRRLILLGKDKPRRLSISEVTFTASSAPVDNASESPGT